MWVPAHSGIQGNERADKLTKKKAVKKENVEINIKLSKSGGKSIVWREINKKWQQQWDNAVKGKHLYKAE